MDKAGEFSKEMRALASNFGKFDASVLRTGLQHFVGIDFDGVFSCDVVVICSPSWCF